MTARTRLTVLPNEPIGTIAPELHGHFAEHLGKLVYPGIWVGEDSAIPNIGGLRTDVVRALRAVGVPVLRWPGGCFADDYNWRDGIGPREQRPSRLNTHWGFAEESNHFGTHEFVSFARAIGAEPYFAGNLGSGSPRELRDWLEYCNQPAGSTLAEERRSNGSDEPFGIRLWGIGNENWGCGGQLTPQQYAEEFARYRTFAFAFGGTEVDAIACGPSGADWNWTRGFFEQLIHAPRRRPCRLAQGFAAHYYCGTAGTATEYTDRQWLELLTRAVAVEGVITGHRAIMDEYDPERRIGLVLDEWGAWHPVEPGTAERGLYQQNTIRDALVAALSLDIFHNHADKLVMANIAQLINVLQALLLVDEDRCVTTPTYHVFSMYAAHRAGQAVRLLHDADVLSNGEESEDFARRQYQDRRKAELPRVSGSASINDDRLCLTLVNAAAHEPAEIEVRVRDVALGRSGGSAEIVTLATDDIHQHNTFDAPDRVRPAAPRTRQLDEVLRTELPAASVTRVSIPLR